MSRSLLRRKSFQKLLLALVILTVWQAGLWWQRRSQPPPVPLPVPSNLATPTPIVTATNSGTLGANIEAATLVRVVDGDTLRVLVNGQSEAVRVIGINTPESVDPRKPLECLATAASGQAKAFLTAATASSSGQVWLESDPTQGDRDRYQRLLRYVFVNQGTQDFGQTMIALGFANEYTYNEPYKYQTKYRAVQAEAMANKVGLWAEGACESQ